MIQLALSRAGMAAGLGLLVSATVASGEAQSETPPVNAALRIASFDGQPLNLYAGPSSDQPVVALLSHDEPVTLLGNAQVHGITRWVPIRTATNQVGWISDQYVVPITVAASGAVPAPSNVPEMIVAEAPAPTSAPAMTPTPVLPPPPPPPPPPPAATPTSTPSLAPAPMASSPQDSAPNETSAQAGGPLEVEVKVKYPEAKSRYQEVTIWVTRGNVPVSGALVTLLIADDEDEPVRILEPTNADGRTRREFSIGKAEKGSIEVIVAAVAPDGGEGRTSVSYFRR